MGGRYFITGVQIGLIKAYIDNDRFADLSDLIEEIEKQQYLGDYRELKKRGIYIE